MLLKTLAFDVSANNTGWSYIDLSKKKLGYVISKFEYGNIQPSMTMDACQKLYFFGNRIKEVIEKFDPDEIAFEEPIQVMGHGFSTARILARFNGVGIYFAYQLKNKEAFLYEPSKWKKSLGLNSHCHKTEVQLEIVKRMKLLSEDKYSKYHKMIQEEYVKIDIKDEIKNLQLQHKQNEIDFKKQFSSHFSKTELKEKILSLKLNNTIALTALKNSLKKEKKKRVVEFNKALVKIGTSIYTEAGMNFDVTDSFGINFCMLQQLGIK